MLNVFYTILILGGGPSPGVTIIPGEIRSTEACDKLVAFWDAEPPVATDLVTGRPVITRIHKCVPINGEAEIERLQDALAKL